jgi:hypothetical protein
MNKLVYALIVLLFIACSSNKTENISGTKSYFDFDEITHIRILISDTDYNALYSKQSKTEQEEILFSVLTQALNKNLTETTILSDLEGISKIEYTINNKYFEQLNTTVFIEKQCGDFAAEVCDPCYRDILLFKKKGILTGVGKFSFNCRISDFSGVSANYECFGAFGEFDVLRKILKDNSAL